jgi:hypothetical protein
MTAEPSPATAEIVVTALAAPCGVTAAAAAAVELPIELVATTENVYAVPSVKPAHEYVVAFAPTVQVAPAGEDVTV